MGLIFIRRGDVRIPTIDLGSGLLRPVSVSEFFAVTCEADPAKVPSCRRKEQPNIKMVPRSTNGMVFGGNHSHEEKIARRVTRDDHFDRPHLKYRCWKDWRQSQYYH